MPDYQEVSVFNLNQFFLKSIYLIVQALHTTTFEISVAIFFLLLCCDFQDSSLTSTTLIGTALKYLGNLQQQIHDPICSHILQSKSEAWLHVCLSGRCLTCSQRSVPYLIQKIILEKVSKRQICFIFYIMIILIQSTNFFFSDN